MRHVRTYSGMETHQWDSRQYGFLSFLGDVIMTFITGGLWLIWIFCREMRRR